MRFKNVLAVSTLAAAATGVTVAAHHFDQLWLAVAALSGAFAGGGAFLHLRNSATNREIEVLRGHLDSTRQHAALLARHTRELRESVALVDPTSVRANEFAALSALVRDIADGVAELDQRTERTEAELVDLRKAPPMARSTAYAAPAPQAPPAAPSWVAPTARPAVQRVAPAFTPSPAREEPAMPAPPRSVSTNEAPRAVRQLVAAAIAADRFDLYLQRVVGLPQRRVRGYDVTLRPDGSDPSIANSDIRQAVEAVGHQLAFDRKLMIQAIRLARVFEQRDREVVLFVDISQRFLMSEAAFDELDALIADVPRAAERIVLCLPQRFFKKAVAFEHEALRTLGKMGFSFAMREIEDLDIDAARLAQMGVRWLRMDAHRFLPLAQESETLMEVSTLDFVALLARRKLSFLVEAVSEEGMVADLLDLNVEFAQGNAFSPPQAVRADVLDPPATPEPRRPEPQPERRTLRDLARRA